MRRPAVYVLAAAAVAIYGLNWPIMSSGVDAMPALWLGAFRMAGAAAIVATTMAARGSLRLPSRHDLPIVMTVGLFRLALVNGTVLVALQYVPSGRSSILASTSALWAVPIAAVVLHERLTSLRLGGLALGATGLVLLLQPWSLDWSDGNMLIGLGLLAVAAITLAATSVHVRSHRWRATPLELMPWQLAIAAIPLAVIALTVEGMPTIEWTLPAAGIVAYQAALASGFATWGELTVMRSLPAISANIAFMAVPVVGLGSSIVLVDEPASVSLLVSLALVLAGVGLGLLSDRRSPDPQPVAVGEGLSSPR